MSSLAATADQILAIGWVDSVEHRGVTGSTNDDAKAWYARHCQSGGEFRPHRRLFVCDRQTAGRGRAGKRFEASEQTLTMTLLLPRGEHAMESAPWLTVARAVAESLRNLMTESSPEVTIKPPNDVLIDGDKVAGVLIESVGAGPRAAWVVGIGINVGPPPVIPDRRAADAPPVGSMGWTSGRRGEVLMEVVRELLRR